MDGRLIKRLRIIQVSTYRSVIIPRAYPLTYSIFNDAIFKYRFFEVRQASQRRDMDGCGRGVRTSIGTLTSTGKHATTFLRGGGGGEEEGSRCNRRQQDPRMSSFPLSSKREAFSSATLSLPPALVTCASLLSFESRPSSPFPPFYPRYPLERDRKRVANNFRERRTRGGKKKRKKRRKERRK